MFRIIIAVLLTLCATISVAHENRFQSVVLSVYDGDTIHATINIGLFKMVVSDATIRLHGIDAPEIRGSERPQGLISADWLRSQIDGKSIVLEVFGEDKYGRLLGVIWLDGRNINQEMIANDYAKPYD